MNRHERRASLKSIRHSGDLITHLIAVETPLDGHPILHNAVRHWYANIAERRPICIACRASFVDNQTRVGAFLLSLPDASPDLVATSAFCRECHATLTAAEVDAVSTRLLRQLAPGGRFLS